MLINLTFSTILTEPSVSTRECYILTVMTLKKTQKTLWITSWRMKMFSRPDGFRLYGKLGVNFFTTSDLLYPNMKVIIFASIQSIRIKLLGNTCKDFCHFRPPETIYTRKNFQQCTDPTYRHSNEHKFCLYGLLY